METQELVRSKETQQSIQLVKGEFTPMEASHVILALLDQKINFHKIERLQLWEENHGFKTEQLDGRIKELQNEKKVAKEFIDSYKSLGQNLKINGTLEITLAD
jgi:hypothetical protein